MSCVCFVLCCVELRGWCEEVSEKGFVRFSFLVTVARPIECRKRNQSASFPLLYSFFSLYLSRSRSRSPLTSSTGPRSASSSQASKPSLFSSSNLERDETSSSFVKSTKKFPQPPSKNRGRIRSAGPALATISSRARARRCERIVREEDGGRRRAMVLFFFRSPARPRRGVKTKITLFDRRRKQSIPWLRSCRVSSSRESYFVH